ncbi:MAG TPA: putative lipid II flippase FtsW [Candidatus Limnocylindria bacterium]|jgi:cell division protein FtsW
MKLRFARTTTYDLPLVAVVLCLLAIGLAMVYSASGITALDLNDDPSTFLAQQSAWAALGIAAMLVASRVDYRLLRFVAVPLLLLAIALLAAVLVPGVGVTAGGATRWLRFGGFGLQPAELAKLALIVYLATWLGGKREQIGSWRISVPFMLVTVVVVGLVVAEPDLGTAIVVVVVALAMYFAAGARLREFAALFALAAVAVLALAVAQPYRYQRLLTFLDPWADQQGFGFQTIQMLYALGLGGPFGEGLGAGKEKFGYLPHPYTDSIFAVLGDELGLAGALVVVFLFLFLAFRGVRIALRAETPSGALLATGITIWLCFQAWVNMAVVASLVPMTGITLPFISYGGSSLCVGLIAVGILLNVGRARSPQRTSVPRAARRWRDGRARESTARGRGGAPRAGARRTLPVHRWSSRTRG